MFEMELVLGRGKKILGRGKKPLMTYQSGSGIEPASSLQVVADRPRLLPPFPAICSMFVLFALCIKKSITREAKSEGPGWRQEKLHAQRPHKWPHMLEPQEKASSGHNQAPALRVPVTWPHT